MITTPFILEVCNVSDMQARHMHKILTVTLKSTLNKLKYGRSFLKETFHLG